MWWAAMWRAAGGLQRGGLQAGCNQVGCYVAGCWRAAHHGPAPGPPTKRSLYCAPVPLVVRVRAPRTGSNSSACPPTARRRMTVRRGTAGGSALVADVMGRASPAAGFSGTAQTLRQPAAPGVSVPPATKAQSVSAGQTPALPWRRATKGHNVSSWGPHHPTRRATGQCEGRGRAVQHGGLQSADLPWPMLRRCKSLAARRLPAAATVRRCKTCLGAEHQEIERL